MNMRWEDVSFVLGILFCFIGALVMFEGNIWGAHNTVSAIVIGIVGIGLIVISDLKLGNL
jgi:hypothetical protein